MQYTYENVQNINGTLPDMNRKVEVKSTSSRSSQDILKTAPVLSAQKDIKYVVDIGRSFRLRCPLEVHPNSTLRVYKADLRRSSMRSWIGYDSNTNSVVGFPMSGNEGMFTLQFRTKTPNKTESRYTL